MEYNRRIVGGVVCVGLLGVGGGLRRYHKNIYIPSSNYP